MVLSTFWRLMSGFMAVNVGIRIPGVQSKLKALAQLPEQLQILSARATDQDGMASLIRRAVHLFDLIMGKVVGSNGATAAILRFCFAKGIIGIRVFMLVEPLVGDT